MLLITLIFSFAFAQSTPNAKEIDFETLNIHGKKNQTKAVMNNQKPETHFNSLLKPRIEFQQEMMDSCNEF